jgi:exopolyphosphatase/guanosine-5'-triphosphate,3'-diphosphate pyrophosphatase
MGALAGLSAPKPVAAYAVGGSATSLRKLLGPVLDDDALAHGLETLATSSRAAVARRFKLHPERVRLLPASVILLAGAAGAFGAPLRTCGGGLREGVLLEELRTAEGPGASV